MINTSLLKLAKKDLLLEPNPNIMLITSRIQIIHNFEISIRKINLSNQREKNIKEIKWEITELGGKNATTLDITAYIISINVWYHYEELCSSVKQK